MTASVRGTKLTIGVCAVGLPAALTGLRSAPALAQGRAGPSTLVVTITRSQILAPLTVSAGAVVFKVVNNGKISRDFSIAGKRTPQIAAGKSATLKVVFTKGGGYLYLSYGVRHTAGLSGELSVVDTCLHPVATTVKVQMQEAPETFSQTTIPCGTVTFVVTNAGTIPHSLEVTTPSDSAVLAPGGQGPQISPGQTVTMTVRFSLRGSAFYHCGEIEHDEMYGETGTLHVV